MIVFVQYVFGLFIMQVAGIAWHGVTRVGAHMMQVWYGTIRCGAVRYRYMT